MNRTIRGLEDHETQERKRLHRDVRSPSQRLADALKLGQVQIGGMFGAGMCLFLFPVLATPLFLVGIALFLARCACVNGERLPFRMPMGLSGTDRGDPLPGRGGFARPEGIFFLGNRLQDKQELWLKAKDILTHCLLFGTTGSGKTETLVSLSYNALATASGLFYIDPKASPKLAVQIWQMARFLGRDDDFRVLNYGTSGKVKGKSPRRLSNTNNPFTFGSAEALTQLLVSLMPASDGANSIFADKAQALISGVMYALVDLRDKGLLKLSTSIIRDALALEKCVALALHPELDEESRASIQAALATSGWIAGRDLKDQPESFAEQFGYAQSYFGKALSSLTDTYSHIYGAEDGEVDFADSIMQQCIEVQPYPYKFIIYCFYFIIVVKRRPKGTRLTACIPLFCRYIRGYSFMVHPYTAKKQPCEITKQFNKNRVEYRQNPARRSTHAHRYLHQESETRGKSQKIRRWRRPVPLHPDQRQQAMAHGVPLQQKKQAAQFRGVPYSLAEKSP